MTLADTLLRRAHLPVVCRRGKYPRFIVPGWLFLDGKNPGTMGLRMKTEPLSWLKPGGSGRDHRSLDAALATWTTLQRSRESTAQPFEPPTHSDSVRPEADQRRQADACHTPGWFEMACSYAGGTGGLPPRPGFPRLTQRPAGTSLGERSVPDRPRRDPAGH